MWTYNGWIDDTFHCQELSATSVPPHEDAGPLKHAQDSYILAPCWYSYCSIPFGIIQYDFALSLFLGFNFLPQTPELVSISFPSTCGIHFRLPQVSVPHELYFCVVSCLFCLFYYISKHSGSFSTRQIFQQCLWLEQPWPVLKRKLI